MIENPQQPVATLQSSKEERVAAARLLLLKLGLDTEDPRWSSALLEQIVDTVVSAPGGSIGDLLNAALVILGDYRPELSHPMANLLKDLVRFSFTHRLSYDATNWTEFNEGIGAKATNAQLYLAMYAVPEQYMNQELASRIASGLARTPFGEEAASQLAS
jgi:hypothetical protein